MVSCELCRATGVERCHRCYGARTGHCRCCDHQCLCSQCKGAGTIACSVCFGTKVMRVPDKGKRVARATSPDARCDGCGKGARVCSGCMGRGVVKESHATQL
jgi:hypothetical protein